MAKNNFENYLYSFWSAELQLLCNDINQNQHLKWLLLKVPLCCFFLRGKRILIGCKNLLLWMVPWQIMSGFRKDYFLGNCDHLNQESTVYCLRQFWKSWKIGVDPFSVYCFSTVLARLLAIIARLIGQAYSLAVYILEQEALSTCLMNLLKLVYGLFGQNNMSRFIVNSVSAQTSQVWMECTKAK